MTTKIKIIIGANAGDEGKGLATDYFSYEAALQNRYALNVLSNGGSQRGHTVTVDTCEKHVFHHFGSGSFLSAHTYLPEYYIVNPMNWAREYNELLTKKIYVKDLLINRNCRLTTPFDMIANQIIEESRHDKRHGSCGMGIWETILRDGITVGEMAAKTDKEKAEYLMFVRDEYFKNRISAKGIIPSNEWDAIINNYFLIGNYIYDFNQMMNHSVFCNDETVFQLFDHIIFENGQGLLLDQNIIGYGKNTTPSNTGLQNPAKIIKGLKFKNPVDVEVCYVTRTYMTRHGIGRFDTECDPSKISWLIKSDETNKTNQYQGKLRYGFIDWDDLIERITDDFNKYADYGWKMSLFITHANEYDNIPYSKLDGIGLYVSYSEYRNGIIIRD